MPFFARPNLTNEQFKQLNGSENVLSLSGQTQIATTSGLTLSNGSGSNVVITASGASSATNNFVLTYRDDIKKIILASGGTGGGSGIYPYNECATTSVGGLLAGFNLFNVQVVDILQEILVPTLNPTFIPPTSTFSISPSTSIYEVGTVINITATSTFNRGSITPPYGTSGNRSGCVCSYNYGGWIPATGITSSLPSNIFSFGAHSVTCGNNPVSGSASYLIGEQPFDSSGNDYDVPLPAGTTASITCNITGLYPYYYGKVASGGSPAGVNRPSPSATLITGGTKVVNYSTNTICIAFNSTSDDYIWFAIPNASTSKTKWYVDALNNGNIGGAVSVGGNLFPDLNTVCNVGTACWSGQCYKLYISNYQTSTIVNGNSCIMQLRNS